MKKGHVFRRGPFGIRFSPKDSALRLLRLCQLLAGRRADELRTAQELLALQRCAGTVLAAKKTRHRGCRECPSGAEWRACGLGAVAKSVGIDGRLDFVFGHGLLQLLLTTAY